MKRSGSSKKRKLRREEPLSKQAKLTLSEQGEQTEQSQQTEHARAAETAKRLPTTLPRDGRDDLPLNYYHLLWIFVIASIIGLVLETIYHFIVFGGFESRAGLVWGPFSPIYGSGAVLFALISRIKSIEQKSIPIITVFVACALAGATLEFIASWLMQTFFGVIAWDYSDTFLNVDGRTNLFFGLMWGVMGTVWICWFLPAIIRFIDSIPLSKSKFVTVLVTLFMLLNILATCLAVGRAYERSQGIPVQNQIDAIMDTLYGDTFIEDRFENATVDPGLNAPNEDG